MPQWIPPEATNSRRRGAFIQSVFGAARGRVNAAAYETLRTSVGQAASLPNQPDTACNSTPACQAINKACRDYRSRQLRPRITALPAEWGWGRRPAAKMARRRKTD